MLSRRHVFEPLVATALLLAASCTSGGAIDPTAVANALKSGCGILVSLATITAIINAAAGATLQMLVDLICSSFKASVAQSTALGVAPLAVGDKHNFVLTVGGKTIPVEATVVEVKP